VCDEADPDACPTGSVCTPYYDMAICMGPEAR
jgi:hypothetical protein